MFLLEQDSSVQGVISSGSFTAFRTGTREADLVLMIYITHVTARANKVLLGNGRSLKPFIQRGNTVSLSRCVSLEREREHIQTFFFSLSLAPLINLFSGAALW